MDCMTRRQIVSGVPALGAAALHPAAANAQAPRPETDRGTLEKIIATAIAQALGSGDTGIRKTSVPTFSCNLVLLGTVSFVFSMSKSPVSASVR